MIKEITQKLKNNFWNYYKEHKSDMIKEQEGYNDYFQDEHDFDDEIVKIVKKNELDLLHQQ